MARPVDTEMDSSKLALILKAMSNVRRLRILQQLADGKERSASEIEALVPDLSQSALSQHLGRLRRAQIVQTRRKSQTIFYSIRDQDVLRLLRLITHIYADDPVIGRTRH